MNNAIWKGIFLITGFALMIGTGGCAVKKVWISNPAIQAAFNPYYEAQLKPLTGDYKYFVSFRLTITSKTDKDLKIDWNKTRYIYNGRLHDGLIFKGIKPEDIKSLTIPEDTIPSGHTFSKVISPFRLLARPRVRERPASGSGIYPGIMPTGENGIMLVVRLNGKEIVERMSVNIQEKKAQ